MNAENFIYSATGSLEKTVVFFKGGSAKKEKPPFFCINYYPYGKILRKFTSGSGVERYLTTGHERDEETISENNDGTGLDNRGARLYDSDVARFLSLDPHAINYPNLSDYSYVANNPIRFIDPDGKDIWDIINAIGRGVVDNTIGTNLRASYTPTDPTNYNNALNSTDASMMFIGTANVSLGGSKVMGGIYFAPATEGLSLGIAVDGAFQASLGALIMYNTSKKMGKNNFGGENDTESSTSNEAFRKAKDQNGVPRSQQPESTSTVPDKNTGKPLKLFEFKNSFGKRVQIRKDNPVTYPDGGSQGPHFNAGPSGKKLKQHHDFGVEQILPGN